MEDKLVVTIQDIADEVGISRGTVDRVLNHRGRVSEETARKVQEAAKNLGYQKSLAGTGLAARKKKMQFGFIYVDSPVASFHRQVYEAAVQKARELAQYGVTVLFFGISAFDQEEQYRLLKQFVLDHAEICGWVVLGDFVQKLHRIWNETEMQKVPVVTYNMDTEDRNARLCFVGCDYRQAGRIACGLTALFTEERGKVLVVSEDNGQIPSGQERIEGFEEEMVHYPQMCIAGKLYMNELTLEKRKRFWKLTQKCIEEDSEIDTVYLMNPSDYGICDVIQRASGTRRMKVITNDLVTEQQRQMILDGRITATIDQEPSRQGRKPLEILFRYLAMDRMPDTDWVKTHLSIIIRQNLIDEEQKEKDRSSR